MISSNMLLDTMARPTDATKKSIQDLTKIK